MASNYYLNLSGDWNAVGNWSTGAVPVTGDTVYILTGTQAIITNLNQSAVTLAALYIGMGFVGQLGSATANLQIGATLCYIGVPVTGPSQGIGSGRIRIDFGSAQTTVLVYGTSANSADLGLEPARLIGSHASNAITVQSGLVGIGTSNPTDTATMLTGNVVGGTLNYGFGATWTNANASSGGKFNAQVAGAGTVLTVGPGGTAVINGASLLATANITGTAYLNQRPASGGTTTLNLYGSGTANFSQNPAATTVGTLNFYAGGALISSPASPNHVTVTSTVKIGGGNLTLN
jgi:hypothetical protein